MRQYPVVFCIKDCRKVYFIECNFTENRNLSIKDFSKILLSMPPPSLRIKQKKLSLLKSKRHNPISNLFSNVI